jgi:3-dehydroquinate dehydratase/shikimate dehydrogenase
LLAGRFGAPFTFATFHHERTLAPGQLSFTQMTEIYHYERVKSTTAVYGVIGDPISHSLSPLVHNAALAHAGIDGVYIPFRVPREHLAQFLEDAPALGVRGLSVTIPHKELVAKRLSKSDATTDGVGAANTLVYTPAGIEGYNTDHQAAIDSLESAVDAESDKPFSLQGKVALVLGAGGAAKAIAYGLKRRGAVVTIAGRTPARAAPLAARLECQLVDWGARYSVNPDVLINCTPVGMHPNVDATPYEKHHLRPSMLVFDTVYNPENTLLIKEARSQSCTVVTGVEMFIRQAGLQFKLFTGQDAPSDMMREMLKRAIGPARY